MTESMRELLARYLVGDVEPAEAGAVERRLEADPELRRVKERLEQALLGDPEPADPDVDRAWTELASRLRLDPTPREHGIGDRRGDQTRRWRRRPVRRMRRWAVAASVTFALAAAVSVARVLLRGGPDYVATYVTDAGQRTTVRLPDGTEATIAPASTLRVLEEFGEDGRPVELDGLALFSVATDPERPFTVAAHGARVRVVGTRFAVHAYDSASVDVAVEEGIVDVGTSGGAVARLTAGDAVSIADERLNVRRGTDVEPYLSWTRGRLRFDDVTVADLARELTRWYAVPVIVEDSTLAARRISIEVVEDELDEALQRAALAVGARLTRDGDTVRLESIP